MREPGSMSEPRVQREPCDQSELGQMIEPRNESEPSLWCEPSE